MAVVYRGFRNTLASGLNGEDIYTLAVAEKDAKALHSWLEALSGTHTA
jgi:hypothetical protein